MADTMEALKQTCIRIMEYFHKLDFAIIPSYIPAAAAGILEKMAPGEAFERARKMADPGWAFWLALAAESVAPQNRRDTLARLAEAVPYELTVKYSLDFEGLLVRVDPQWGWKLLVKLVTEETVLGDVALGLTSLAYQEEKGEVEFRLQKKLAQQSPSEMFQKIAHADRIGRLAFQGKISKQDPGFDPLMKAISKGGITSAEISALLGGAIALDPGWGLELAHQMGKHYSPDELWGCLCLIAESLANKARVERLVEITMSEEFIMEQAYWLWAAVIAGALHGERLHQIVAEFRPRVIDELDPGDELMAGLPILMALATAGENDLVLELALEWKCPPPVLVNHLFNEEINNISLVTHPKWPELLKLPQDCWAAHHNYASFYWWDPQAGSEAKTSLCRDVLTLAIHYPWYPRPGSVADIIRWKKVP